MTTQLAAEFDFFMKNIDRLVEEHKGRYVVIKGTNILGVYDDMLSAVKETSKTEELGTFLVQKCSKDEVKQTFHSRVLFH